MEGSDTLDKVAKSVPGCKGISENATFRATSRRFATRSTVAKGLILNELVGCERSFVFFEAFTTEESALQLGLQKMHNVSVRKNTATISATLFKDKNNKENSKSINIKIRGT